MKKTLLFFLCLFLVASFTAFAGGEQEAAEPEPMEEVSEEPMEEVSTAPTKPVRVGVFVPGRLGDSPPYDRSGKNL